jgi:hypothetical protein
MPLLLAELWYALFGVHWVTERAVQNSTNRIGYLISGRSLAQEGDKYDHVAADFAEFWTLNNDYLL